MRYTGLTTLFAFTFGAFLMATTAGPIDGQDKKAEPSKLFPELVKFEKLDTDGKAVYAQDGVPAGRGGTGKLLHWDLQFSKIKTDGPFKSVQITDKDGKVYKSTKVKGPVNVALRVYYDAP